MASTENQSEKTTGSQSSVAKASIEIAEATATIDGQSEGTTGKANVEELQQAPNDEKNPNLVSTTIPLPFLMLHIPAHRVFSGHMGRRRRPSKPQELVQKAPVDSMRPPVLLQRRRTPLVGHHRARAADHGGGPARVRDRRRHVLVHLHARLLVRADGHQPAERDVRPDDRAAGEQRFLLGLQHRLRLCEDAGADVGFSLSVGARRLRRPVGKSLPTSCL